MKCLLLLLVLGPAAAFPNNKEERIIGDYTCKANSVPYLASLNAGDHHCGGALINDRWVVSAAHCYKSGMKVRLGKQNIGIVEGTEQFISAAKIIRHPEYNPSTFDNDIMLLKISKPAVINNWVRTVSLPSQYDVAGTRCLVSGWGSTVENANKFPNCLQCLDAAIMSDKDCKDSFDGLITNNMFCAGFLKGNKDSCQGNSGGPVVCNGILQGIVLGGIGFAQSGKPTVFTKVSSYVSWIKDAITNN